MREGVLDDALTAANKLLGYKLIHETPAGRLSGYIVETEAYSMEDPASHSFRGHTPRTAPMFGAAGTIYVYFTYGMHYCFNIVTGPKGHGQAVLIRAIEPLEGIEIMQRNRARGLTLSKYQLTNGPAKAAQALGITAALSGTTIWDGPLRLEAGFEPEQIVQTTRVGITKAVDQPWRFYIQDNPYVSRPASKR